MNEIEKVKREVKLAQWMEIMRSQNESGLTVADLYQSQDVLL